jgi:hypothetical protein
MIRVTTEAFEAVAATLPLGSVGFERERDEENFRHENDPIGRRRIRGSGCSGLGDNALAWREAAHADGRSLLGMGRSTSQG